MCVTPANSGRDTTDSGLADRRALDGRNAKLAMPHASGQRYRIDNRSHRGRTTLKTRLADACGPPDAVVREHECFR